MAKFLSTSSLPGALLVNELPLRALPSMICYVDTIIDRLLVRHIPEWMPWFSYKPLARFGYNLGQEVIHEPMRFVKESIVSKTG